MDLKSVLITGANKGIGFEVCRELGKLGFYIILTSRDERKGLSALDKLKKENINCEFVQLDVSELKSIVKAFDFLSSKFSKIDVVINNAGISVNKSSDILDVSLENINQIVNTNSIGPLLMVKTFLPLLKAGCRVINVSSTAGSICNDMGSYSPVYSASKTFLNAITIQLSYSFRSKNIPVNAVCPGWVRTDMGGMAASRSVEKGAESIVWLATEAPANLTGKFIRDKKQISW